MDHPQNDVKQRFKDRKIRQGKRKIQVWVPEEVYFDLNDLRDLTKQSKSQLLALMIPIFKQQLQGTTDDKHQS